MKSKNQKKRKYPKIKIEYKLPKLYFGVEGLKKWNEFWNNIKP